MKKLIRKRVTAAGIIAGALAASSGLLTGCNINETVYGPPPSYYEEDENIPETVYGPPEDLYSSEDNQLEDVYGPPEDFDAEENIEAPVYGPPEDPEDAPSVTPQNP